ncbi:MAG: DUF4236 domain-containing protein [Nitrospirae bacterium]|nr:DUF4236 domain-containing protein [Nitrospirota bacterium]
MGFRFYRRVKILPGISLNLSKGGLSLSAGVRGARLTFGQRGITRSLGIPGTGLSVRDTISSGSQYIQKSKQLSTGDRQNDEFVKDLLKSGSRRVSLNTQELKEMYDRIKTDDRIKAVNPSTGRKVSLRELEAKNTTDGNTRSHRRKSKNN